MVARIAVSTAIVPEKLSRSPCCAACSSSWSCGPCTWKPAPDMGATSSILLAISDEIERQAALGRLRNAAHLVELAAIPKRELCIAGDVGSHLGELEHVDQRHCFAKELRAADHEHTLAGTQPQLGQPQRRRQRWCRLRALGAPAGAPADDDVAAAG